MIAKVINLVEKQGAKGVYYNVTVDCSGHKTAFNVFDKVDQTTFRQAKEQDRSLDIVIEKNEKGYDNLKSVKFVDGEAASQPTPPVAAKEATLKVEPVKAPAPVNFKDVENERNRAMAVSYAKDLAVAGKIAVDEIIMTANRFVTFIESGKV